MQQFYYIDDGDGEIRTLDPLLARQVLSQLSYAPVVIWQPPTFPYRYQYSIIGRLSLNHRVRDGYGCFPLAHRHQKFYFLSSRTFIIEQHLSPTLSLRKEVIQPHLPIRLPCYDFTPVIEPAFDSSFLSVRSLASGIPNSHGVTGGVYKTRERIHRSILICDY